MQARWTVLGEHRGVNPRLLWNYSETQFQQRNYWNAFNEPDCAVPMPVEPTHAIEWLRACNLTSPDEEAWLPASYVLLNYVDYDATFARADSTGAAAGASIEDAVLRGLLEVIERDAAALWWYNRCHRPPVRAPIPQDLEVERWLSELNRRIWLLDLTTEWQVPVTAALSARNDGSSVLVATAAGTTFDESCERAIRELAVSVTFEQVQTGLKQHWLRRETLDANPWLQSSSAIRSYGHREVSGLDDLLERARVLGRQVLSIDLTRPSTGWIPVVKVCVPGMCSGSRRTGPGRLYDAPVNLGWLAEPRSEAQINHWPLLL